MPDEFFIRSTLNNLVISIRSADSTPGARLITSPKSNSNNAHQRWTRVDAGGGAFFLRSALNGHVVDISGGAPAPGTPLISWPKKDPPEDNQLWTTFSPAPGGTYLVSKLNGFAIDIDLGHGASDAPLISRPIDNPPMANQIWVLEPVGATQPVTRISAWEDELNNWFTRHTCENGPWIIRGPAMIVELHGSWSFNAPFAGERVLASPLNGRFYVPDGCSINAKAGSYCTGFRLALKTGEGADAGPDPTWRL